MADGVAGTTDGIAGTTDGVAGTTDRVAGTTDGVAAQDSLNGPIKTDYFTISYEDGNRAEAQEVASFADEYYEVIFQRFGVEPVDELIPVRVVDEESMDCTLVDAAGCYKSGVKATIYVTSDSRSLFYHELTHRFQARAMEGGTWIDPPGSIAKFDVFVEGTARYLGTPADDIAARASFRAEDTPMTTKNVSFDGYDDLALFSEFVLHEFGREGLDVLYTTSDPREVATLSNGDYPELVEQFYDQLPKQASRMADGGAPLVGFTYDPFLPEAGSEVTFDARTPSAIEQLGKSWYDGEANSYEWDFDGDGEIEATGPTVTRTIDDPANTTVTLYVTIDGERHRAEQDLLDSSMALGRTALEPVFEVTDVKRAAGLTYPADRDADHRGFAGVESTLNVTVHNRGITGSETVELRLADRTVATRQLDLGANGARQLSVEHVIPADLDPGTYEYEVVIGNQTWTRTVYVENPNLSLKFDSMSVPNGTEGWLMQSMVKPGKRMEVVVDAVGYEDDATRTETVEFYVGDRTIAQREVTFTSGYSSVRLNFTAPSEPGNYHIRGSAVSDASPVDGFARRIKVREDVGIAEVELEDLGTDETCSATIKSAELWDIYKEDDEDWFNPENVSAINPGDDVQWLITLVPSDDCQPGGRFAIEVAGDDQYAYVESAKTPWANPGYTFEEPGRYEVRAGGTVISTVNVTAEPTTTTVQTTTTSSGGDAGNSEETESESGAESETTDRPEPTEETTADATGGTPGFGVPAAVVALLVAVTLARRRRTSR